MSLTFVHIPKTGGMSIRAWLMRKTPRYIHPSLPMMTPQETFAVVRNPWDRVVSLWAFWNKLKKADVPFDTFVRNLSTYKFQDNSWFTFDQPQKAWIPNGVTYLLKFETLDQDFVQIQNIYECTDPLPKVNTSEHADYRTYYTQETWDIVATTFKDDIEAFGYGDVSFITQT